MPTTNTKTRPSRGRNAWVLGAALLALPCSASASLGGDVASVQVDRSVMNGTLQVATASGYAVHEIQVPDGMRVREYVSAGGVVFGVAWQGPFKPNLQQLLGTYFDEFQEAARAAKSKHPGRAPVLVDEPDLVVHMSGHPRAFFGRAYIPELLPADVAADDVK
jgi:hypothetical protein